MNLNFFLIDSICNLFDSYLLSFSIFRIICNFEIHLYILFDFNFNIELD